MTPKEKAEELVEKFKNHSKKMYNINADYFDLFILTEKESIQCAIIAVDEILSALEVYDKITENYLRKDFPSYFSCELQNMDSDLRYWQQVKAEIEKM